MPCTCPEKLPVARNDSSLGTVISKMGLEPLRVPMVRIENEAGCDVWYSASAAAIFIGWYEVITLPCRSPETATATAAISVVMAPALTADRCTGLSAPAGLRSRCHIETPSTSAPATRNAPEIVCGNVTSCALLVITAQKLVSSSRCRAALYWYPTGCCIHELATRMKYPDSAVPIAAIQMHAACTRCGSRSQPKIHSPRKVDSMKNASSASIASGAPKMSPTNRE